VFFVDNKQAELVAVLVDVAIGTIVGGDSNRGDVVAPTAEHADRLRELVAKGVGEGSVPLVHEIDRRRHDERTNASIGDCLQAEERLPAARWEDHAPSATVIDPRIEGGLLVVTRFDMERWREIEIGIGPSSVFDGAEESIVERCLPVAVRQCPCPFEERYIPVCLCSILVDAVVPLRVGHILGCVTEQEGSVVEFDPHSLRGCTRPGGFNVWVCWSTIPRLSSLIRLSRWLTRD